MLGEVIMRPESRLKDAALRLRVCRLIENGLLPALVPGRVTAKCGSGRACAACDQPITSSQTEYEVEDDSHGRRLRFHMGCHVVWKMECAQARHELDEGRQSDLGGS
jgi:ferredoxin